MHSLFLIFAAIGFAVSSTTASAAFRDPASIAPTPVKWGSRQPSAQDQIGLSVMCSTGDYSVVSVSMQNRSNKTVCLAPSTFVISKSDEKRDPTFNCRILPANAHDLREFTPTTGNSISGCGGTGLRVLGGDIYEAKFTFENNDAAKTSTKKYQIAVPSSCDTRTAQINKYDFECDAR